MVNCSEFSADMPDCNIDNGCEPNFDSMGCESINENTDINRVLWNDLTTEQRAIAISLDWTQLRWDNDPVFPPPRFRKYWVELIDDFDTDWIMVGSALGHTEDSWNDLIESPYLDDYEIDSSSGEIVPVQRIYEIDTPSPPPPSSSSSPRSPPSSSPPVQPQVVIQENSECWENDIDSCESPSNNCKLDNDNSVGPRCIWDCDKIFVGHPRCQGIADPNGAGCEPMDPDGLDNRCSPIEEVPFTVPIDGMIETPVEDLPIGVSSDWQSYSGVPHQKYLTSSLGTNSQEEIFRCRTSSLDGTVMLSNTIPTQPEVWEHGCNTIAKNNIIKERQYINEINDLNIKINNCISWNGGDNCQNNQRIEYNLDDPFVIDCSTQDCTISSHGDAYDYCCATSIDTVLNGSIFDDNYETKNIWLDKTRDPPCWSNYNTGEVTVSLEENNGDTWIDGCSLVGKKHLELKSELNNILTKKNIVIEACRVAGGDENCDQERDPTQLEPQDCSGMWSECDSSCIKRYVVNTPSLNGGQPCGFQNDVESICLPGEGYCPPNTDCDGTWSPCSNTCQRTFTVNTQRSGNGSECPQEPPCSPGQDDCPSPAPINCSGNWSECSETCEKTFQVNTPASNGGTSCPISPQPCSGGSCPSTDSIDCSGEWSECNENCQKIFNITTANTISGLECTNQQNDVEPCEFGEGRCCQPGFSYDINSNSCVANMDCSGTWSLCTSACTPSTFTLDTPATGTGSCLELEQGSRSCNPGDGECPQLNCIRPSPAPPGYRYGPNYMADFSGGGITLTDIQCDYGYYGSPYATPCTQDGGAYVLEGCEPIVCEDLLYGKSETDPGFHHPGYNYNISDPLTSLDKKDFNINNLTCSPGWEGDPVAIPCQVHGGVINLEGCNQVDSISPAVDTVCTTTEYINGCTPQVCFQGTNNAPHPHCLCRSMGDPPGCVERECIDSGDNPYTGCKCTSKDQTTGEHIPIGCRPAVCTIDENTPYEGCILPICTSGNNVPFEGCIPQDTMESTIQLNRDIGDSIINIQDQTGSSIAWWDDGQRWLREGFSNQIDRVNCPSKKLNEKSCPDGQTNIDGKCYQVCTHCDYNDNTGYFGDCIHPSKFKKQIRDNDIFDDNYLYFNTIDVI